MEQAQGEIAGLRQTLQDERAAAEQAVATLKQEHAVVAADLNDRLVAINRTLDETRTELDSTRQEAAATERALGEKHAQQMSEALQENAELEQSLEREKAAAAERIVTLEREHSTETNRLNTELAATWQALKESRQAREALERLNEKFAELRAQHTERGMRITLAESDLQFAGGQASLPDEELESLDRIAEFLNQHPSLEIRVEGHTDSAGSDRLNARLSGQRAEAVKQALVARGVESERITAEGMGETQPIASNQTYDGRRKNRRVEIYVVEGETP
jgi:outer membrane protein OmpA-like peptidoglycan-associated protein